MKKKIVIVEDNLIIQELHKHYVLNLGHEVVACFENGQDVIDFFKENTADLILMDIRLGDDIDGVKASQEISEMIPVPIIYGSPEKWASFQKQGYLRDLQGRLMAPLLMFKRNNIEKNRSLTNKLDANDTHNIAVTNKKYSPQNAYSKFNILNGIKPEQTLYATVVPDYITVTYDCAIFTYYNDQLNKIIEAVEYASDVYWGDPERFKFKTNIDSFSSTIELSDNAERIVKSTFTLKMFGYIIPDVSQKDTKFIPKFSDKNRVLFTTETTLDINNLPTSL